MMIFGHTALGIATGLLIPNPLAAFAVGVVSHHIADALPHYDPGSYLDPEFRQANPIHIWTGRDWLMVGIDIVVTLVMMGIFMTVVPLDYWNSIAAGIVGANFPDMVHHVPWWNRPLRKISWINWWFEKIHRRYQWTLPLNQWPLGIATQLAAVGLATYLVLKFI